MTKKERAAAVTELLKSVYPEAVCALHYTHDYELLFATRLSAQCTDARVNIVTEKLFKQFPTLQSFADASEEEIAEAIKTCGLFRTKARDLKACAMMLIANYGGRVPFIRSRRMSTFHLSLMSVSVVSTGQAGSSCFAVDSVSSMRKTSLLTRFLPIVSFG